MKYEIPNKLNLLGEVYKVKVQSSKNFSCREDLDGKIEWDEKIIYLDSNSEKCLLYVLLHELGHYFGDYYDISNDECFAEGFARFVYSIINQVDKE